MAAPIVAGAWSLNPTLDQKEFLKMYSRRGGLSKLPNKTPDDVAYVRNDGCRSVEFVVM